MRKELLTYLSPKSPISEIFRTLRTNIQFMNAKGNLKTILVTSILPGEGKSWVSSNLAVTFAQAGKRVILVDSDMRKGRQYSIFGVSPRPGLSNYLSGMDDSYNPISTNDFTKYIQKTEVENLYLISAGNVPPNPSELLISERMANLINGLKEMADIVIFDGPPSQLVTDSLILTRYVDTTVIVSASKIAKKDALKKLIGNIRNVGGRIAGVVVNKVPMSAKRYEDAYYYGSTTMAVRKKSPKKTAPTSKPNNEFEKPKSNEIIDNSKDINLEDTQEMIRKIKEYVDTEKMNLNYDKRG